MSHYDTVKHTYFSWFLDKYLHRGGLNLQATFWILKIGPLLRKLSPFKAANDTRDTPWPTPLQICAKIKCSGKFGDLQHNQCSDTFQTLAYKRGTYLNLYLNGVLQTPGSNTVIGNGYSIGMTFNLLFSDWKAMWNLGIPVIWDFDLGFHAFENGSIQYELNWQILRKIWKRVKSQIPILNDRNPTISNSFIPLLKLTDPLQDPPQGLIHLRAITQDLLNFFSGDPSTSLTFGNAAGTVESYYDCQCVVDELRGWDVQLTDEQVAQLYHSYF